MTERAFVELVAGLTPTTDAEDAIESINLLIEAARKILKEGR